MFGHGRPRPSPSPRSARRAAPRPTLLPRAVAAFLALVSLLYIGGLVRLTRAVADETAAEPAADEARPDFASIHSTAAVHDSTIRVRIAWGGGESHRWTGTIEATRGRIRTITPLGVDADETGSMKIDPRDESRVIVNQRSGRTYDGLDIECDLAEPAERASLNVALAPAATDLDETEGEGRAKPKVETIDLHEVAKATVIDRPIGAGENRLLVMRSPGDMLRVTLGGRRDHMIFSPAERFEFTLQPHRLAVAAGAKVRLRTQLSAARGGREIWSQEDYRDVGKDGAIEPLALSVKLPEAPGVYEVQIIAHEWGLRQRFDPAKRFVPGAPLSTRTIQLVVQDAKFAEHAAEAATPMRVVVELDPANPRWWKRFIEAPQLQKLSLVAKSSWDDGKVERWDHPTLHAAMKIGVDSWEALPLPIEQVGVPHVVEIDYPSDQVQSLGVSVLDPNAAGELMPIGLDSGVYRETPAEGDARWLRHRLIFWPRTKAPLLLLTNRHARQAAAHGKIRVLAGGPHLPPATGLVGVRPERLLGAYFDRPLLAECFSASEARDPWSGRSLDDWVTFYEASTRFAEYLEHVGYCGAMVGVASEGSAIYPSRVLEPTPRYDTGVFFSTGHDPVRKDALELLLRVFDRRGMLLVPSVQFTTPLPALEALVDRGGGDATGITPIGPDGLPAMLGQSSGQNSSTGAGHYYNPLDPRVQQAMLDVIAELVDRYGHHPALGGVGLQLTADGYGLLPGVEWSLDDVTWAAFERDAGVTLGATGEGRYQRRADAVAGTQREAWLRWRAERLADFQRRAAVRVARAGRDVRLYVAAAGVWDASPVRTAVRPSLTRAGNVEEAFLAVGLDVRSYGRREMADIVFLRPNRIAPQSTLETRAADQALNQSAELDRALSAAGYAAQQFYHEPARLRLPTFDEKSPFGKAKTYTYLVAQMSPSDSDNRRRFVHALATSDAVAMFDGGHLLPIGQEESLTELFEIYQRLPAGGFKTVAGRTQPVTIRTRDETRRTVAYLVNDSPWKVTVDVNVEASARCRVTSLSSARRFAEVVRSGESGTWRVAMEPYGLVGVSFSEPGVVLSNPTVTIDGGVAAHLRQQFRDLGARAQRLSDPPRYDVLENASFEQPSTAAVAIPGWQTNAREGATVTLSNNDSTNGRRGVEITSTGPVASLISDWFEAPSSGRLAVLVMLRTTDANRQPSLRVAIETSVGRTSEYRYRSVGAAPANVPLRNAWGQFLIPLDNLPTVRGARLRVRFDLMSAGEVHLDDVRLHHLSFSDNEQAALGKIVSLVDLHLRDGRLAECAQVLDGYWPRYLEQNVPLDASLQARRAKATPGDEDSTSSHPAVTSPSLTAPSSPTTSSAPAASASPPASEEPAMRVIDRLKKLKPF